MLSIRAASPADVDIVTEIEAKCFPPAERASRERFVERLNAFSDCFLILMKDDRPVGLVDGMVTDNRTICDEMFADAKMHNPGGHWLSIFGLAVIPGEQHQGYASALMRAFIEKARQEGRDGVILTCKKHLIDFYSGFVYEMIGLPQEIFTPLFAMARIVGWCAHRNEELNFEGKRIIRPAYKNVLDDLAYIPIKKR